MDYEPRTVTPTPLLSGRQTKTLPTHHNVIVWQQGVELCYLQLIGIWVI